MLGRERSEVGHLALLLVKCCLTAPRRPHQGSGRAVRGEKDFFFFFCFKRRQLVTLLLILQVPLSEAGRHLQSSSN